ncbi:MAG: long-chain fatty acid--CoA ligase [Spirochaetes bacterium]|nr:long-chain fatty acid--CoA ligase [Spirochaetota bacterium]
MAVKSAKKFKKNIIDVFFSKAEAKPDHEMVFYKHEGSYRSFSRREMKEKVEALAKYLISKGIKKGDRVSVFSFNRYEWWVADLAALSIGAVHVPIYPTNSAEEALYAIRHSSVKICFTGSLEQYDKTASIKKKAPSLKEIISFDELDKCPSFELVLSKGAGLKKDAELLKRRNAIKDKDLCSIIYTSGTTGNPKGVMLSYENFYSDMVQVADVFKNEISENEIFMSFLPLSHALERTAAFYTPIYYGCKVAFSSDIRNVIADTKLIFPNVLNSVPRLYEKIHSGIFEQIRGYSFIKRSVVLACLKAGSLRIRSVCEGVPLTGVKKIIVSLAEKIVLSRIKNELGFSNVKVAISGGAALSVNDMNFFMSLGINLYEGYGLTECAPILTVNKPGKIKRGTVGCALYETEIAISDEGEILAKGDQIMIGYYKNPKATKEVFDKSGFFRTGDLGYLDKDGYLKITGRIKDIIVTAGGKNVSPQNIEAAARKSKFVEQLAVIGDKRKFLSAIVVVNPVEIKKLASSMEIRKDLNGILTDELVNKAVLEDVEKTLKSFSRVEQIRRIALISDEWSQATGELTGTLKIKRRAIEEKYARLIDAMYIIEKN